MATITDVGEAFGATASTIGKVVGVGTALVGAPTAINEVTRALNLDNSIGYQSSLQWPDQTPPYYMTIRFVKYQKRSVAESSQLIPTTGIGKIILPIPKRLIDTTSLNYNTETLGPAVGAAVQAVAASSSRSVGSIGGVLSTLSSAASGSSASVAKSLIDSVAGVFPGVSPGQASAAVSVLTGVALNPFQTIIFQNNSFKIHNFDWLLTAESVTESDTIRDIIQTLKYHSLPGTDPHDNGLFLTYPDIALISLNSLDTDNINKYTYNFKPCVIENLTFNYAASGTPSFFQGTSAPTAISLNMQCKEIELWTKNDFSGVITSGSNYNVSGQG